MDVAACLGLGVIPEEEKLKKIAENGVEMCNSSCFSLSPDGQEVNHQMA